MTDRDAVALTVWAEARGESLDGRIAVACVIRNRVRDGRWGTTYTDVCLAPRQFSCWNAGTDANHRALVRQLAGIVAGEPVTQPILRECQWIADGLLADIVTDRVGAATHYYAAAIPPPAWAATGHLVARVGNHLFFAGVT